MQALLINALVMIARQLIGSDLWAVISTSVNNQDLTGASGADKHAAVVNAVKAFGIEAAAWAVNLAIEVAVTKLRFIQGEA